VRGLYVHLSPAQGRLHCDVYSREDVIARDHRHMVCTVGQIRQNLRLLRAGVHVIVNVNVCVCGCVLVCMASQHKGKISSL
jgi:hypothetical protein